jgi:hypothetical protein
MGGTAPTPETSVSIFVWVLVLIAGLIVVTTLLAVRRRHHLLLSLALGVTTLFAVALTAVSATVPPAGAVGPASLSGSGSPSPLRCPYDRMVWANMGPAPGDGWLPCRRAARIELTVTMLGAAAVVLGAALVGLRLTSPAPGLPVAPAAGRSTALPVPSVSRPPASG